MSEKRDREVTLLIKQSREKIKSNIPKDRLQDDAFIQEKTSIKYGGETEEIMIYLHSYYEDLLPYTKNIKSLVRDITEETHICAIYLLLCHTFETWRAFFQLIEGGYSIEAGILLRNIQEADMLATLFMAEFVKKEDIYLKKWFSGKIITHGEGRKKVSAFYKEIGDGSLAIDEASSYIHQIESLGAHNAYIAMLGLVSPFTEDFDFGGYTQIRYCRSEVGHAMQIMTQSNITLKAIYGFFPNKTQYKELDTLLKRNNPEMEKGIDPEIIKEFPSLGK